MILLDQFGVYIRQLCLRVGWATHLHTGALMVLTGCASIAMFIIDNNILMGILYISFSTLYSVFSAVAFAIFLAVVLAHIYAKLKRPKPLNLSSDSVVVIIGACMGIGKLMAIQIARQYHSTIILVDRKKELFEQVSKQIKQQNGICQCLLCDLSDLSAVDHLIEAIKDHHKKIDLLLYNAGILIPSLSWQASEQDLHSVMNVNFFAPIKLINGLLPRLEGGHIAVVASVVALIDGAVQLSSYLSSKHAIYGYINSLRQELKYARRNITVSMGCPYAINTTMFQGFKTTYEKLLPTLDENYVAERLVRQFVSKKEVCFIGRRHAFLVKLSQFLPTYLIDWTSLNWNISDFSRLKKRK